jgi:hypothetical protein
MANTTSTKGSKASEATITVSLKITQIRPLIILKLFSRHFQIELNRKREAELAKLKEELDNSSLQHETGLATLRQKHNAVIADLVSIL